MHILLFSDRYSHYQNQPHKMWNNQYVATWIRFVDGANLFSGFILVRVERLQVNKFCFVRNLFTKFLKTVAHSSSKWIFS